MERVKGFEPSASTLARLRSTPELHPHCYEITSLTVIGAMKEKSRVY